MTRRRLEDETCVAGRRFRMTEVCRGRIALMALRREWPTPPRKRRLLRRPAGLFRIGQFR